jgi:hypothetical protein
MPYFVGFVVIIGLASLALPASALLRILRRRRAARL